MIEGTGESPLCKLIMLHILFHSKNNHYQFSRITIARAVGCSAKWAGHVLDILYTKHFIKPSGAYGNYILSNREVSSTFGTEVEVSSICTHEYMSTKPSISLNKLGLKGTQQKGSKFPPRHPAPPQEQECKKPDHGKATNDPKTDINGSAVPARSKSAIKYAAGFDLTDLFIENSKNRQNRFANT